MTEIDIDVVSGPVRVIPLPATFTDVLLVAGPCELAGWSLRDSSGDIPKANSGSVLSPAANATITSLTGLPAGTYQVSWEVELTGAAAAADGNNFALNKNGVIQLQSVNAGAAGVYPQIPLEITVASGDSINITAIAAGTVGVTYSADLSLVPVTAINSIAELQDGNNPLAELECPSPGTDTHWFGSGGLTVRNRINYHPVQGIMTGAFYVRYARLTG